MVSVTKRHVYGNFKDRGTRPAKKDRAADKRPGMDADHAANIRLLPCAICMSVPAATIHHLKQGTNERGMGLRATDKWGVPMCMTHHDLVERAGARNEITWFEGYGIRSLELARDLWASRGDLPRMTKIVIEHRRQGRDQKKAKRG